MIGIKYLCTGRRYLQICLLNSPHLVKDLAQRLVDYRIFLGVGGSDLAQLVLDLVDYSLVVGVAQVGGLGSRQRKQVLVF